MLKIMLCDDDARDLYTLKALVEQYWEANELQMPEIQVTQSAAALIQQAQNGTLYDIYMLDILMEETDGIEVGKEIRKLNEKSIIIYVTGSSEFALRAFGVYATGYLIKPVSELEFATCMERVLRLLTWEKELTIAIKSRNGVVTIEAYKLMRVENIGRVMHFYMDNGEVIESVYIRQSFETQLKELLQDFRFIQPHKSFIINALYVEKMLARDFVMVDHTMIPVSRSNHAVAKRRYLEYLSKS